MEREKDPSSCSSIFNANETRYNGTKVSTFERNSEQQRLSPGGYLTKFYTGRIQSRDPIPYLFIYQFYKKGHPFLILIEEKYRVKRHKIVFPLPYTPCQCHVCAELWELAFRGLCNQAFYPEYLARHPSHSNICDEKQNRMNEQIWEEGKWRKRKNERRRRILKKRPVTNLRCIRAHA